MTGVGKSSAFNDESNSSTDEYITEEILDNFKEEAAELLERVERSVLFLERDLLNINLVRDIFRDVHTIKGNCSIFSMYREEELCAAVEDILQEIIDRRRVLSQRLVRRFLTFTEEMKVLISQNVSIKEQVVERPKLLGEILLELGAVSREALERALRLQDKSAIGEILLELGDVSRENLDKAVDIQFNGGKRHDRVIEESNKNESSVRVELGKLDSLFDIVGKIMVKGLCMREPEKFTKLLKELNQVALSLRMVTLESLFIKLERLVRQERNRSGKGLRLELLGSEIEMDKVVIQQISAPLIHILRNAIDHGIESRGERAEKGKPEEGVISIKAHYKADKIIIRVSDDGRGIDRKGILEKAREIGELEHLDETELDDEEISRLIYRPGLSTAGSESSLSGRGIGMDVVRRDIELLEGQIEIESEEGWGTEVSLIIPLSQNIIEGLVVKIEERLYLLHTASIEDYFSLDNVKVVYEGGVVKVVNSKLEKISCLRPFAEGHSKEWGERSSLGVIINMAGLRICLLVDELVGREQVILTKGFAVLSNGDIGELLDDEVLAGMITNKGEEK